MMSVGIETSAVEWAEERDARQVPRTMTIYRGATLESGSRSGLCVIKNLSSGGAMVQTIMTLHLDEAVSLVMPSGRKASGKIRWQQAGSGGIEFDKPTPPSWLLDRYAECNERSNLRRFPRVCIAVPALVRDRLGATVGTTCDLSTHGMRIMAERALAIGPISINIDGLGHRRARALWSTNLQSGCVFDQPFSIDEIMRWLRIVDTAAPGSVA